MPRIMRRSMVRHQRGKPMLGTIQRLIDDGKGNISSSRYKKTIPCENCLCPISEIFEMRGLCSWCGRRHLCQSCEVKCRICSRRLCGACRTGFVGDGNLITVCPQCLGKPRRRQARKDKLERYQMDLRLYQLKQQQQARRAALRIQAARLRLSSRQANRRESNRMRMALLKNGIRRLR